MIAQTILPTEWIIVNDGSTDGTAAIIDAAAMQHAWIRTVHRNNRGYRKAGGGVIEAFYDGYKTIRSSGYQFIVKFDGDLSFEPDYFERCFSKFAHDPNLGIGGGFIGSQKVIEKEPLFHVRGATKIYKKECWNAIGQLIQSPGWDTLDEVKANMKGWKTLSFLDVIVSQLKVTGSADGIWKNWVKNGLANYISGYHPLFMLFKCIKRLPQKPRLVVSAGLFWGFCLGYLKRMPQVNEPELIEYLRKEQLKKLQFKKSIW
jgi:glycosyltransferase involved in cell wall biosynthesis